MSTWGINPLHISLCSFLDGYVDVITYSLFHVYCTMMTGNLITLAISVGNGNGPDALFVFTVILSYTTGNFISCYLTQIFDHNRLKCYLVTLPFQLIGILIITFIPEPNAWFRFLVLPLIFSFGMLNAGINRFGYTPQMMTGNMQKLAEALFKYTYGIKSTSEKEKRDVYLMIFILISYFLGAVCAGLLENVPSLIQLSNLRGPLLLGFAIIPIKLFSSSAYTLLKCDIACTSCCHSFPTSEYMSSMMHRPHLPRVHTVKSTVTFTAQTDTTYIYNNNTQTATTTCQQCRQTVVEEKASDVYDLEANESFERYSPVSTTSPGLT